MEDAIIVVVDSNTKQCQEICDIFQQHHYQTTAAHSLASLEREFQGSSCRMVVLDLDTLSVNNRLFREIKKKNPGVCIIVLSKRPFHPELEEAMSKHIHACLGKPVDDEELIFWVRALCDL